MTELKPQKLLVYNKHLPYNTKEEAERQLSEIKYNLSRAVVLQEINPGLSIWFDRFIIYLRLQGRNFTKEDHVLFINLFLNLMEMPEMGPSGVKGIAMMLQKLLKKEELLTRDDLTISWRPLYELVKSIKYSKLTPVGLEKFPSKYVETIMNVIKYARSYFPVEATEEMLLEFRPLMCPTDATKTNAALYLSLFLPTKIKQGTESQTYLLWLDELMEYWFHCTTNNVASVYLRLFSRFAEDNAGYIDWSKYTNRIFNSFFCNLNLPINGMRRAFDVKITMANSMDFAKWFVYMMGGSQGTVIFDKLEKLFVTLKSFYHPSNYDRHASVLLVFLNALTSAFVMRLNHERYRKASWTVDIPQESKITDAEIERYVNIVKEVALLAVYSKQGSLQAALTLQNLALLRADLVIPQLLQSTFEALETLVEPHQVTATLMCITSVARPLASGSGHFPSAPTNILPLLRLVLPGIDPNDFRKSMCAFNFISAIISLVPLVNCMPAVHAGIEMTEVEKELCLASEQFEDLILQFFDRCFVLVENSIAENITQQDSALDSTASAQDNMLGRSLVSTVQVVFMQCSQPLFEVALNALFRFVSSRVLEVDVSGKLVSDMCRGAVRARPKETLKKMLSYITNRVINLATVEGVQNEENVDPELLWYLEMLSELGRCNGVELLQYKDVLKEVIKLTLHMKCKKAYSRATQLLKAILCSVSEVYVTEWMSLHQGFDLPPTKHFYIRDWGKPCPLDDLNPKWHSPNRDEILFADELLKEFLVPELNLLKEIINGRVLTRDEIHQHLQIIATCLYGAANLLPNWTDDRVEGVALPSLIARRRILNTVNMADVKSFVCIVNRKDVTYQIHKFFNFMLKTHEDDTKSFRMMARIYDILVLHNGVHWSDFNVRWKSAAAVKKALADRLHGNKMHVRAVQIERVQLQHDMRVLDQHAAAFSVTDKVVIDDLIIMATSEYAEVRIHGQKILFGCLEAFDVATRYILPKMLENIDPKAQVSHEKLKGTLYILQYSRIVYMLIHDWKLMASSWIPIVQANQSEKPSIVKLLNYLIRKIQSKFETMKIERKIGESAIKFARELLRTKSPEAKSTLSDAPSDDSIYPSDHYVKMGQEKCAEKNKNNLANYRRLEQDLSKLLQDTSIHWRCSEMCGKLMNLLLNNEVKSSHEVIKSLLDLLVNDSLLLRQYASRGIMGILHQYKPQFAKRKLDYTGHNIDGNHEVLLKLPPGDNRPDNKWLQYNDTNPINSQEDLERFSFIDKTHWGYQTWPLELDILTNQRDFYSQSRSKECLCQEENLILETLRNSEYLEKFIKFHSMEIKKGVDRFQHIHYTLFKGLFRNYGPPLFEVFQPVVTDLLAENNESKHRLAIEIIAGMIRGSKHWNYESLMKFWDFMVPLLRDVLASNVMEETVKDWVLALVVSTESHDPNRFHRLFTMLLNNPINGDGGSQGDTNRLFILRKTLGQQEWRLANVNQSLMKYLLPHLTHPFQNVREKVGSLISYILLFDLKYASHTPTLSPRCEMFVDYVYEDLLKLYQITLGENEAHEHQHEAMEIDGISSVTEETKKLERMAKTVLSFLVNKSANFQPVNRELYRIIPLLLVLESREDDPELVGLCKFTFPALASKQLPDDLAQHAIQSILKVCYNKKSWNLRRTGLNYMMMMIFHNLYILDDEATRNQLQEMLIERLKDEQVEVREIASKLLSGLVHFGYFSITEELLSTFHTMAKTKMKKKRHGIELTQTQTDKNVLALQLKHGGVLGLSALVLAFPYDVCAWIPQVVIDLGNYLHEVPQISATAKKTLSEFRRTHHDNWHIHQQQFTDDQLSSLTDLLVSPSYYA